jgi:periplasmic divalent cation tolerance protein
MQTTDVILVLTHTPDLECAKTIAKCLLAKRLAACINIGAPVLSVYEWESAMHETQEIPLVIKTTLALQGRLVERLVALHPYDLPEALVVPVLGGYAPYLDWVRHNTSLGLE